MRMTQVIVTIAAGVSLAVGVVGGSGAATDSGPRPIAWIASSGSAAEQRARAEVAAARAAGAAAEARFPRDLSEHATDVRYLRARGFEVRVLDASAR
jgi:hypothetical protein